ncbi:hypothetical protein BVI2075_280027 [Burkholderia vietnamiensis]|nr:hypothetical protein BVI2075_280027 [Burkholderia vietnamiensis]
MGSICFGGVSIRDPGGSAGICEWRQRGGTSVDNRKQIHLMSYPFDEADVGAQLNLTHPETA